MSEEIPKEEFKETEPLEVAPLDQFQGEVEPLKASGQTTSRGSFIHIDHSVMLKNGLKFAFTYSDDDESLGSSVCSGLRNSLHSSFDFKDLDSEDFNGSEASFGDLSFGDQEEVTSWRENPEVSESDWTMTIESVPSGDINKYHVHKTVLQHGYKRGDFFVSLFEFTEKEEKLEKENSTIKVHEDAACLIPEMLDYMYSLDDELTITSDTAAALSHLSQFFGIKQLAKHVLIFMREDICVENMNVYLNTAMAFDDLQTLKLCADRCAEMIEDILPSSPLLPNMDPSFMLDIVSSRSLRRKKNSGHLSKLVAVYCINNRGVLDGNVFEELTGEEYLPKVDEEAALPLLMLESRMVEDSANDLSPLTSLQKRCVRALLPIINGTSANVTTSERRSRQKALDRVPKKVLVDLLSRSLC
ncbi:BTB/POZ domain containing protein [Nitzschia inconspicua]|uniref:BTB/POZ domain containing protein n=1 Tax=Nitzschia inconspicua TaxID=303405 RepID=A0A9K3LCG0_9STRA|nr:BTB/POZ domain containing protein [Nitzschia inconspicua]